MPGGGTKRKTTAKPAAPSVVAAKGIASKRQKCSSQPILPAPAAAAGAEAGVAIDSKTALHLAELHIARGYDLAKHLEETETKDDKFQNECLGHFEQLLTQHKTLIEHIGEQHAIHDARQFGQLVSEEEKLFANEKQTYEVCFNNHKSEWSHFFKNRVFPNYKAAVIKELKLIVSLIPDEKDPNITVIHDKCVLSAQKHAEAKELKVFLATKEQEVQQLSNNYLQQLASLAPHECKLEKLAWPEEPSDEKLKLIYQTLGAMVFYVSFYPAIKTAVEKLAAVKITEKVNEDALAWAYQSPIFPKQLPSPAALGELGPIYYQELTNIFPVIQIKLAQQLDNTAKTLAEKFVKDNHKVNANPQQVFDQLLPKYGSGYAAGFIAIYLRVSNEVLNALMQQATNDAETKAHQYFLANSDIPNAQEFKQEIQSYKDIFSECFYNPLKTVYANHMVAMRENANNDATVLALAHEEMPHYQIVLSRPAASLYLNSAIGNKYFNELSEKFLHYKKAIQNKLENDAINYAAKFVGIEFIPVEEKQLQETYGVYAKYFNIKAKDYLDRVKAKAKTDALKYVMQDIKLSEPLPDLAGLDIPEPLYKVYCEELRKVFSIIQPKHVQQLDDTAKTLAEKYINDNHKVNTNPQQVFDQLPNKYGIAYKAGFTAAYTKASNQKLEALKQQAKKDAENTAYQYFLSGSLIPVKEFLTQGQPIYRGILTEYFYEHVQQAHKKLSDDIYRCAENEVKTLILLHDRMPDVATVLLRPAAALYCEHPIKTQYYAAINHFFAQYRDRLLLKLEQDAENYSKQFADADFTPLAGDKLKEYGIYANLFNLKAEDYYKKSQEIIQKAKKLGEDHGKRLATKGVLTDAITHPLAPKILLRESSTTGDIFYQFFRQSLQNTINNINNMIDAAANKYAQSLVTEHKPFPETTDADFLVGAFNHDIPMDLYYSRCKTKYETIVNNAIDSAVKVYVYSLIAQHKALPEITHPDLLRDAKKYYVSIEIYYSRCKTVYAFYAINEKSKEFKVEGHSLCNDQSDAAPLPPVTQTLLPPSTPLSPVAPISPMANSSTSFFEDPTLLGTASTTGYQSPPAGLAAAAASALPPARNVVNKLATPS